MVDVELAAGFGGLFDGFLRLAFAADKEDLFALAGEVGEEISRLVDLFDGFLDVEDVDLVLGAHDEALHLGVPALGLMSEMDSGFDEFGEDLC
jgi:hypothetical protein